MTNIDYINNDQGSPRITDTKFGGIIDSFRAVLGGLLDGRRTSKDDKVDMELSITDDEIQQAQRIQKKYDEAFGETDSSYDIFYEYVYKILTSGSTVTLVYSGEVNVVKALNKDNRGNIILSYDEGDSVIVDRIFLESENIISSNGEQIEEYRKMLMIFDHRNGNHFPVKSGNKEMDTQKLIHEVIPDKDRLPIIGKGEFSNDEKREKIQQIREVLKLQYQALADVVGKIEKYLSIYENASFIELHTLFIEPLSYNLSPQQYEDATRSLSDFIRKRDAVRRYFPEILKNPKGKAEEIFGLEEGTLIGNVEVQQEDGVICFMIEKDEDYKSLHKGETALKSGGFATQDSQISELQGTITVQRGLKLTIEDKKTVQDHETQHQRNKLLFSEYKRGYNISFGTQVSLNDTNTRMSYERDSYLHKSLTRAKDEIIAFLRDGSDLSRIEEYLTNKQGSYNYHKDIKDQAYRQEDFSSELFLTEVKRYQFLWSKHVSNTRQIINLLRDYITDSEGNEDDDKLDLYLLAVAPYWHWKFLLSDDD